MMDQTPLDTAYLRMMATPQDDTARLRFHERVLDAELSMILEEEPTGETIKPLILDLSSGPVALLFDTEERLAAFTGQITPYVTLSGRRFMQMLHGQAIGIGLNLGAPSETVLSAETVDWCAALVDRASETLEARIAEISPPQNIPEAVLEALDQKLRLMAGMIRQAWLVDVRYLNGSSGAVLALADVPDAAQPRIADAIGEALRLSGIEAGQIDVAFLISGTAMLERVAKTGLGLEFTAPPVKSAIPPAAPGSDPDKPPRLR